MGGKHQRVDWPLMEQHTVRGMEEVGCKIYGGAPTVRQTTG